MYEGRYHTTVRELEGSLTWNAAAICTMNRYGGVEMRASMDSAERAETV